MKSPKFLKKRMELNWNFQSGGGGELKPKTFHGECIGYFLEQHISSGNPVIDKQPNQGEILS